MDFKFKFKLDDIDETTRERLSAVGRYAQTAGWILFGTYLAASAANTVVILFLIGPATVRQPDATFGRSNLGIRRIVNYRDLQKTVLERLLFNSEGELPEEADPSEKEDTGTNRGDIASQPCTKSSLPIDLVGTIYLGDTGDSLATVQEKGYTQADVYRKGDEIIGHEQARVYQIEQKRLIVNNDGKKECLELKDPERPQGGGDYAKKTPEKGDAPPPASGDCGNIVLKEDYVKKELGPDFQTILKKGRLIPNERGFKLIGVNKNSLFGKICLNNGDILTQINDISMQEPDKGFTFYKVFQDERAIRISLLRNGTNPMTINVQIE